MPGSARRRGKTWTAYWRDNGKQRSKGGFPTKRAALDYASRQHIAVADGTVLIRSHQTLAEYMETWLAGRHSIRASTRLSYGDDIRRIPESIGSLRVSDLTADDIQAMINELIEAGYSYLSIIGTLRHIKTALDIAVHNKRLAVNPARAPVLELPAHEQKEIEILSSDQLEAVFAALATYNNGRYESLCRFLLATQLRISEALGLVWDDVDWDEQTVRVHGELKTSSSRRTIYLDDQTIALLRQQNDRQQFDQRAAVTWEYHGHIFTNANGSQIKRTAVATALGFISERSGVHVHAHLFRHTGASWLLIEGVPVNIVSQRLGHANPSVTMRIYAHALEENDQQAAAAMSEILDRLSTSR